MKEENFIKKEIKSTIIIKSDVLTFLSHKKDLF